ncbi:MAG: stage III sporulation protein AD [Lachnospiraceae bacterium]|nr:stage III sporulation protein AD [Lachnospiraceae bacterium]
MNIIAIGVMGITAVLLAIQMKGVRAEYGTCLAIAAGCLISFFAVGKMKTIFDAMARIQDMIRLQDVYLSILLKMAGITYVAEFSSGICRDAGYGAIGNQIEIFGRLTILAVSMPIVLALLDVLQGFAA